MTLRTVHDSIILGTADFITATAGDANTDAATAGGVSTEISAADKATVRLTTAARIVADWAKTKAVSTDSILFCGFCAFKCKLYLLYKYNVDIFKTYEKYYLTKYKVKQ